MGYKTSNIYRSPICVPAHVTERKQNYHHCSWCSPRTAIEPFFTPPAPSLMRLIALKDMSGTTFVNATGRQQWTLSSCQLMRAQIDVCILVQKSKQKKDVNEPTVEGTPSLRVRKTIMFQTKVRLYFEVFNFCALQNLYRETKDRKTEQEKNMSFFLFFPNQ